MKSPKKYIKTNNLPPRVSILVPLVWWLVLERFGAPLWLYGALFTVLALIYIAEIVTLISGEAVDLLGNDKRDGA